MISHKHEFIFVHLPKSAGTSITSGLDDCEIIHPGYHEKLSTLRKAGSDYFTFTCVRNVYDRLVSMVFSRFGRWDKTMFYEMVRGHDGAVRDGASWSAAHLSKYLDEKVDYIMRFDHLEDDWDTMLRKLHLPWRPLPHKKKNNTKKHFSEYYDQKMIDLVKEVFDEEIQEYKWAF